MHLETIEHNRLRIADIRSEKLLIHHIDDGLDLVGTLWSGGFEAAVLYRENIADPFFDLSTGMAGEILQKFSTYRLRLMIVGDFEDLPSQRLKDFIRESNASGHVNFVGSREEALERLGK